MRKLALRTHPFAALRGAQRRALLLVLLACAAALLLLRLGPLDEVLKTREPGGIFALQLAWTGARAQQILAAWRGLEDAVRLQTRWDFAFLLVYPALLSLACAMAAEARAGRWREAGLLVSWTSLAAAPLDGIENLLILGMLADGASSGEVLLLGLLATLKFSLVALAFAYLGATALAAVSAWCARRS